MRFVTWVVMAVVIMAAGYWFAGELGIRDDVAAVAHGIWRGIVWIGDQIPRLVEGWKAWVSST